MHTTESTEEARPAIGGALLALVALGTLVSGCGIREHNVPEDRTGSEPEPGGSMAGSGAGGVGVDPDGAGGAAGNGGSDGAGSGGAAGGGGGAAGAGADPPTDVPGVDLDGTRVPREKAIVILHFGHSNMLGHGRTPTSLREYFFTPQPRLWTYHEGLFEPATEPTSSDGRSRNSAGPGMALLRAAGTLAPDDHHFISIGLGVGSATTQDWSKGGLHYDRVLERALELKGRVTFGAAVVMLGITDRHMPLAQQPGFAERMSKIAADLRADLGTPELPILHTDYEMESTGDLAPDGEVGMRFRPLILMLPELINRCAIVPTDGLGMQDDHHFDMAGQKEWADRTIQILVERGWAPWPAR